MPDPRNSTEELHERQHYAWLLAALLAILVLQPLQPAQGAAKRVLDLVFPALLLAAVAALGAGRRRVIVALLLILPALASHGLLFLRSSLAAGATRGVLLLAFLLFVSWTIFRHVFWSRRVTINTILGSVCVYLLMGIAWAVAYTLIDEVMPGAFSFPSPLIGEPSQAGFSSSPALPRFVYYSFVTLTTLGYGDVLPLLPLPRTLAWLQAVTGQIYMTVLVARLVGIHIAQKTR